MHLLNVRDPRYPRLEDFLEDVPPYAILSHTWERDEVTFQDIQNMTEALSRKAGYEKILACSEKAYSHNYSYCWIDTCCIDKSSSAELSEAINSMFRWYQKSGMCFVYLADVPIVDARTRMMQSRWFERGWTLQELLAPKDMVFYSRDWIRIGTKMDLRKPISEITGIELRFLEGWPLEEVCVAQKMFWASGRKTTRAEDMAYCLLGLFDVKMPLLYGEGDKAFIRLQEEIMKKPLDHSLFAWEREPHESAAGLLAPAPRFFKKAKGIVPFTNIDSMPYQMTNRGVQMALPLHESDSESMAALDCWKMTKSAGRATQSRVWIRLLRPETANAIGASSGVEYARSNVQYIGTRELAAPKQLRTIFILATHSGFRLRGHPKDFACIVNTRLPGSEYFLTTKWPNAAWDDVEQDGSRLWISTISVTREDCVPKSSATSDNSHEILGVLWFGSNVEKSTPFALIIGFKRKSKRVMVELRARWSADTKFSLSLSSAADLVHSLRISEGREIEAAVGTPLFNGHHDVWDINLRDRVVTRQLVPMKRESQSVDYPWEGKST